MRCWHTGDDIAIVSFKSRMHAIGDDVLDGVQKAIDIAEAAAAGEHVVFGDAARREVLTAAGLMRARALVVIRAVQIALAERNDTVSLLLREFEETAADWLWETDAGKQIVKASPVAAPKTNGNIAPGAEPGTMVGGWSTRVVPAKPAQ